MDQDHRQTSLLLYNFLQCSSNDLLHTELTKLGSELTHRVVFQGPQRDEYEEYELQTDGNQFRFQGFRAEGLDSESQEEIIRQIAMQLAQMGDKMENIIQPNLVNDLVQKFRNVNLPAEEMRRSLAATVEQMMQMQTVSQDLGQEKAKLLLTMLLAKKVMTHVPYLFRSIFYITVDYINQNLLTRNLTRHDMD